MDSTFDQWSSWIWTKTITYSLIGWHWLTAFYAMGTEFTRKTVRGILDAHSTKHWIFRERNECPWPINKGDDENPVVQFTTLATWVPSHSRLYFKEGGTHTNHSFHDVVLAELYNRDKSLQYDMSSFFHEFSWRSVEMSPSLYEVVLLYCLTNKLFFSKLQLSGFTLEVLTAEGETIYQRLDSTRSYSSFDGWASYTDREGSVSSTDID
jgi:hypothetical protein